MRSRGCGGDGGGAGGSRGLGGCRSGIGRHMEARRIWQRALSPPFCARDATGDRYAAWHHLGGGLLVFVGDVLCFCCCCSSRGGEGQTGLSLSTNAAKKSRKVENVMFTKVGSVRANASFAKLRFPSFREILVPAPNLKSRSGSPAGGSGNERTLPLRRIE